MKTLTVRQFAGVKRIAQNVNPLVVKKNKIAAKIDELNAEYNALTEEIEGHEMVVKKVEDTGKVDKDGKPIKVTKYEPKAGIMVFNEEANVYEIHVEEPTIDNVVPGAVDDTEKVPETEVKAGEQSPFDPTNPFNGAE